jgi:hypothetical protein
VFTDPVSEFRYNIGLEDLKPAKTDNFDRNQLHKDFEYFLRFTGLKENSHARYEDWVDRLKDRMIQADERTAEENKHLTIDDTLWFMCLYALQMKYGYGVDLFGTYQELEGRNNKALNQYFTPSHVCEMMASMQIDEQELIAKREISIMDPASGTGRMMIGASVTVNKVLSPRHQDPNKVLYVNVDLDSRCFVFVALNAALRNLKAICIYGNGLSNEIFDFFVTEPMMSYGVPIAVARWNRKGMLGYVKRHYPNGDFSAVERRIQAEVVKVVEETTEVASN